MLNTRSKLRRADARRTEILEGALLAMRDHGLHRAGMRDAESGDRHNCKHECARR